MTLHHFENRAKIAEALRIACGLLRPGGRMIAMEPNGDNPLWRLNLGLVRTLRRGKSSTWKREKGITNCRAGFFRGVLDDLFGDAYELFFHHIFPLSLVRKTPRGFRTASVRFLATHLTFCGRVPQP